MTLDVARIVRDGALLALAASALLVVALRANPRLFLRHFPEAVRRSQPPLARTETVAGRLVATLLIAMLVAVPLWSAGSAAVSPPYGPLSRFLHAFLVASAANLADWLVLDEILLGLGRPRWALPPGVALEDVPFSHWQHARGFLVGTILCAIIGVLAVFAI